MAEPTTPSLADLIRDQAAAIGDHIAFTFEGRDVTYRELDLVSNRVANALLADGVGRGDRIAFLDKNTLELPSEVALRRSRKEHDLVVVLVGTQVRADLG